LQIKAGQKIAVVGRTGSGKTTLAQLLLRFYDPVSGLIKIDGHSLPSLNIEAYRKTIAYIPQDSFLFSDSIYNNIALANQTVTREQVERAAQLASVHDEIIGFSSGYHTMIGERGITISGGQKQRVSLARALIKNASFYIFDDCYSAVDMQTEKKISMQLSDFLSDKTAIIITHRISSLPAVDQIWVMDQGTIVEHGTHESLIAQHGLYAELFNLQQRKDNTSYT